MFSTKIKFDWIEYLVFGLMLALSTVIGVYFGFIKKAGQDTVEGYLLGNKKMTLFPVSMSLISSFVSGVAILGLPAEVYTFGMNCSFSIISYSFVGLFCAYGFLPVFYKLQLISVYEYMELRFNKFVRKIVSLLFTLSLIVYIPIVIYGPALALNQVSNWTVHTIAVFLSAICIFYTTFGGLKAVVWTNTVQGLMKYGAVFTVAAVGTAKSNGIRSIINSANEGGRFDIVWDIDPRYRVSSWSMFIGLIFTFTTSSTIHPSFVQRLNSLRTIRDARWSVFIFTFGSTVFCMFNVYMGLVIYSHYKDCDPLSTRMINKPDQILPYFVIDIVRNIRGLSGVFIAGIVSAAMSTMSAGLNTIAGTMYEDFIEPVTGKLREATAASIMKVLVVVFGILCLLLVMVLEKLGSLIERHKIEKPDSKLGLEDVDLTSKALADDAEETPGDDGPKLYNSLNGLVAGALLGIFILGLFFPHVNSTGATAGGLISLATMCWIMYGFRRGLAEGDIVYVPLPVSVEGCTYNFTIPSNSTLTRTAVSGKVFPLFEISIFYYCTVGCLVAVVVGIIVSFITGPNKLHKVDRDLISPLVHRFLPDYTSVPVKEAELETM